ASSAGHHPPERNRERMSKATVLRFFSWEGRVTRSEYLTVGFSLAAVKIAIDYAVVRLAFRREWSWESYLTSRFSLFSQRFIAGEPWEFIVMTLLAIPFMYIGVVYTVKRCRDAAVPTWLAGFFFIPFLKFLMILLGCLLPSREA